MAEESYIWDGVAGGDAGTYSADDWKNWLEMYTIGALGASVGIRPRYLNELVCTSAAPNVAVASGGAIVKGGPYINSANVNVNVPIPAVNTRWDVVVLRAIWAAWTVRIVLIGGVEGAGVPPAITQVDGNTWDLPLCNLSITVPGVITIEEDLRRPTDQGMNQLPGGIIMWKGTLGGGGGRNPVIAGLIYDEWCVLDGGANYNGWVISDWSDAVPMGAGAIVALGATAGAETYDVSHTHASGTLAAGNNLTDHNHANVVTGGPSATVAATIGGIDAMPTSAHTHTQGATGLVSAAHAHNVTGGATAAGGSAVQSVLNPVFGTYFLQYCPA